MQLGIDLADQLMTDREIGDEYDNTNSDRDRETRREDESTQQRAALHRKT